MGQAGWDRTDQILPAFLKLAYHRIGLIRLWLIRESLGGWITFHWPDQLSLYRTRERSFRKDCFQGRGVFQGLKTDFRLKLVCLVLLIFVDS